LKLTDQSVIILPMIAHPVQQARAERRPAPEAPATDRDRPATPPPQGSGARRSRLLPGLLLLLALGGAGGGAWWWWQTRQGATGAGEMILYGNVDIRQVELGFRVSGRIEAMHVQEGDAVRAGAPLASLDARPFRDELARTRAEAEAQRATLAKLKAGLRPEEIAQAEARLSEREASLRVAELTLQRREELVRSNAVSRQALDDARAARDEAQAQLASARADLALARQGFRAEDIAVARAQLQAAEARLATAETALADASLNAPADGIVLARVREPGAIVAAGATVYTLSLTDPVWVRAYVAEPQLGRVAPGTQVEAWTDTDPGHRYRGQVGFVSPVAEFTPRSVETPDLRTDLVYRLRIVVQDPDRRLLQGMPVTLRILPAG
jgi:HlyD family secretion protein